MSKAHLIARSKGALQVFSLDDQALVSGTVPCIFQLDGTFRAVKVTADGSKMLVAGSSVFHVFTLPDPSSSDESIYTEEKLETGEWNEFSFSPSGKHIAWIDKQRTLRVVRVSDRQNIYEGPLTFGSGGAAMAPKWNCEGNAFAKIGKNELELHFIEKKSPILIALPGIYDFAWSPHSPSSLVTFCRSVDNNPASITLYTDYNTPRTTHRLFKADRVDFSWPKFPSTSVLVTVNTDVDQSGQSYYGLSSLHLITINSATKIILDREGSVHDVAWSSDEKENIFMVLYGYMPAAWSVFDGRNGSLIRVISPVNEKPLIGSKNTLKWDAFLAVAGFGNLPGKVEIWSTSASKTDRIGQFEASGSSVLEWHHVGTTPVLLTATTHPRLRVDNGWKVWRWNSNAPVAFKTYSELYQVIWRPSVLPKKATKLDDATLKMAARITTVQKSEPYRPPSLRSAPVIQTVTPDASTVQHPKKTKEEKLLKRLEEKLDQIVELKSRRARGEQLEANQIEKIEREGEVRTDLAALKKLIILK